MPQKHLRVELIRSTDQTEALIALAAKLCYAGSDLDQLRENIQKKDQKAFLAKIRGMGHESVMEHASFTFLVEGVSRVLLAQLTRHRIASFSVQSQRYVSYQDGFGYIVPPAIEALGKAEVDRYHDQMALIQGWYEQWQQKLGSGEKSNEDARFVLPNACETRIMMTMNLRELRHFFSLRMCSRAQWEIREMATQMHRLCLEVAPELFMDAGPGCLRGACPEGAKSCGRQAAIKQERQTLIESIRAQEEKE